MMMNMIPRYDFAAMMAEDVAAPELRNPKVHAMRPQGKALVAVIRWLFRRKH